MPTVVEVEFGAGTDTGAVRELNEDAVVAATPVFAVADGMGGHAAGEVASALAIEQLAGLSGRRDVQPADVLAALDRANAAILGCAARDADTLGMGTTVSGVCLGEVGGSPHWFVFNVGDSRVYRFADHALTQITTDHNEVAELVQAGQLTAEQARDHPRRNVVTRSLGTDPAPIADVWVLPAVEGDTFLICSDGLTLELDEAEIAAVLDRRAVPRDAAAELVDMAVAAGGRDNVSAVVVELARGDRRREADVSTAPRSRVAERGGS